MYMINFLNKYCILFFMLIYSFWNGSSVSAQNIVESSSTLSDAIVFRSGAELQHHTGAVRVPAGNSEIVINQVAQGIDLQSVRVGSTSGQLTILSVSYEQDYLNKGDNKSAQYLQIKNQYDREKAVFDDLS